MRQIINISLPEDVADFVKNESKNNGYASVSEFFRAVLREYKENKILKDLKKSSKYAKLGKYSKVKSLEELLN